ncbi:putative 5-formyltetrahydrofolate cyclo-ligase [Kalaharituber pfeilii]|nr:putative 5-formyltetrahydrofolate cyclo-ligase [Kalaharituber pfeilii]
MDSSSVNVSSDMCAPITTKAAKSTLRKLVKERLRNLPAETIASQSTTCVRAITSLPEYQAATRISVYLSMPGGEAQTSGIVEDAFAKKKTLFVPHIHRLPNSASASSTKPTSVMDMLSLADMDDYRSLPLDSWGIPSIPVASVSSRENCLGTAERDGAGQRKPSGLDMVILPGVAFGTDRRRLGHGKGYYDTWLARYHKEIVYGSKSTNSAAGMPVLVGVALQEQVFEDGRVPVDETDWLVDILVTGDGRVVRRGSATTA